MHVIAAKAVCFHEALQPQFREYQRQVVINAKALAAGLANMVIASSPAAPTIISCSSIFARKEINGKEAQEVLDRAGITVNKNAIPFDTYPIFKPGGIRIGTPAVTTRGMKEEEMLEIADLRQLKRSRIASMPTRWRKSASTSPRLDEKISAAHLISESCRAFRSMNLAADQPEPNPLREGLSARAVPQPCSDCDLRRHRRSHPSQTGPSIV